MHKYLVFTDNGVIDVVAYDGYDARNQVMAMTFGRAVISDIRRA